jgi:hypothetical protein
VTDELWRPLPGWPEHEVSNLGNVRRGTKVLKPTPKAGRPGFPRYLVVKLCHNGRCHQFRVNRLVARVWLGPARGRKTQVDHEDFDTFNNRAENLKWVTQAVNQKRSHAVHPRARDERGRILARAVAA